MGGDLALSLCKSVIGPVYGIICLLFIVSNFHSVFLRKTLIFKQFYVSSAQLCHYKKEKGRIKG